MSGATGAATERTRAAYLTPQRFVRVIGALLILLLVTILVSCSLGSEHIDVWNALVGPTQDNVDRLILLRIRVPRALLGAVVGAGLSAAGAALQALLRNPLAEPHIIGVSGGAALGGVVALVIGGTADANRAWLVPLGAFAGALSTMAVVYRLGSVRGRVQPYTLLLAGVVCNGFTGALIMFVNAVADFFQAHNILFWLMGSLATQSYRLVAAIAVYVVAAVLWLLLHTRDFNALALGEEGAQQLGVNVQRTRRTAFVVSSFLVGAAVSVSGMIGFVGLIVPHVTRLLFGADYRLLLPASVILGGCFLVIADTVARTALGAVEIPVGVVTALCGGPFFLYLLRREGVRQLAEAAIELVGLTAGYGAHAAIRDVTLQVQRGEMVGIIGPNGSGKSTLLRVLSGVLKPWNGHVSIERRPIEAYTPRELSRRVAVVPQETHIDFPFTVTEVVLLGRTPHLGSLAFESAHDLAIARQAMERTDVASLASRRITELSGGERQRVILARALAQEPSMLILDEPSAFLDIRHQVEIYDLLRDLQREGLTVVTVLHDLNLAGLYCDRLVLLSDGSVACIGEPAEVLTYATLTAVYGTEVYVAMNDITRRLNVLPLSRPYREELRRQFKAKRDAAKALPALR